MTDIDAIGYLQELKEYNQNGVLHTPQNQCHDTIWDCAIEHAIRALRERACVPEEALSFSRNQNGSITVLLDEAVMAAREPDGPWTNIRVDYKFIGYEFGFRLRVKAWRHTDRNDIGICVMRAVSGQRPENIEKSVMAACKKQNWLCIVMDKNTTGFPADIQLSV